MTLGIITYAFRLAEPLDRLLEHILVETEAHLYLFLHSQDAEVRRVCDSWTHPFMIQWQPRIHYYPYGENRGLAKSCNEALIQGYADGCDVMMTVNDDVLPRPGDIERIANEALRFPYAYMVDAYGKVGDRIEPLELSCAAINRVALDVIGCFDENFTPAYYEDVDWQRRARLAGLVKRTAFDTFVTHTGSASVATVPENEHNENFRRNRSYYIAKWGGEMAHERWDWPFNNPALGLKIEPGRRHVPYPELSRI